jgi:phosphatidyl-myo-inositol dimannoside synthase
VARFNASQPFPVVRFRRIAASPLEALYRETVLRRWIRTHRPALLVATGSRAVLLAAGRTSGRDLPWVAVAHGTEFGRRGGWEGRALRWAFSQATEVVCVSDFTRLRMIGAGVEPRRPLVIPNGADPERFVRRPEEDSRTTRGELGLEGARILITVGNVTERKGHDIVVRALPSILASEPRTHYVVVGLPTEASQLEELSRSLGVADRVHLLGRVEPERLVRLLNAADLFVMTSRQTADGHVEGFGIAAVEAALCGLPSVVAGGSGLAEAVCDHETGLVVPPEDVAATAQAVLALLGDDSARRAMGERARRRALAEQTWEKSIDRYDAALRDLCRAVRGSEAAAASRL